MDDPNIAFRRILASVIAQAAQTAGFVEVETPALEMLAEALAAFIYQLTFQAKSYSELQNRTEPNYHDIASAFIDLGIDLNSFFKFVQVAKRSRSKIIKPPTAPQSNQPQVLHVAKSKPHPNYIFDHFPEFPDPHTYIHTDTEVSNDREYQKAREVIASQRLSMEKSLIKFKVRSNPAESLSVVNDDPVKEPTLALIENRVNFNSYINALLPPATIADL